MNLPNVRLTYGLLAAAFIATILPAGAATLCRPVDDVSSAGSATIADTPPFRLPGVYKLADGSYEAYVTSDVSKFYPNTIDVPAGRNVTFFVRSPQVARGFYIPKAGVYMTSGPGWVKTVTHQFDHAENFLLVCSLNCGIDHLTMHAVINVYEPTGPAVNSPG